MPHESHFGIIAFKSIVGPQGLHISDSYFTEKQRTGGINCSADGTEEQDWDTLTFSKSSTVTSLGHSTPMGPL